MTLSRTFKVALGVYLASLVAFAAASSGRLRNHSSDTHFSYLAKMWLERRLDLGATPPNQNDWAEVEYLHLKDGRTVAGAFMRSMPNKFRSVQGKLEHIPPEQIENRWKKYYVSFPPFPAVLFLPFVAIWGLAFNDVIFTVILAAFGPMLLFLVLRRLSQRGDSNRSVADDLWLTAMFGVGSVYYYASVLGQVWYTAHIVATVLTGLFVLASLEARHPILAGLCLGGIVLTRPQMGFWGILFLYEMWRVKKPYVKSLLQIGIPVALFGVIAAGFNYARFHSFAEFGHSYLNVRWTDRIQRYGLFNYAFLARNLSVAFTLTPKLLPKAPWLQIPWHGLSMLITTPALVFLLWPRNKQMLHQVLWILVFPIALMSFLYQNDGWVQFGYRFSLDYLFALMMLLAIGNRPLSGNWKALIIVGIAVNLFGAITFGRMWQFYFDGFFPIGLSEL